jgi:hypothetical protein
MYHSPDVFHFATDACCDFGHHGAERCCWLLLQEQYQARLAKVQQLGKDVEALAISTDALEKQMQQQAAQVGGRCAAAVTRMLCTSHVRLVWYCLQVNMCERLLALRAFPTTVNTINKSINLL